MTLTLGMTLQAAGRDPLSVQILRLRLARHVTDQFDHEVINAGLRETSSARFLLPVVAGFSRTRSGRVCRRWGRRQCRAVVVATTDGVRAAVSVPPQTHLTGFSGLRLQDHKSDQQDAGCHREPQRPTHGNVLLPGDVCRHNDVSSQLRQQIFVL